MAIVLEFLDILNNLITEIRAIFPAFYVETGLELPSGSQQYPACIISPLSLSLIRTGMNERVAGGKSTVNVLLAHKLYNNKTSPIMQNLNLLVERLEELRLTSDSYDSMIFSNIQFGTESIGNAAISTVSLELEFVSK